MNSLSEVYIIDATRTGIGKFCGSLSSFTAVDLGTRVIKSLIDKNNFSQEDLSEIIMGQVLTASCGQNPARQSAINAGIDSNIPAFTINKVCGSGLKSVIIAAQSIMTGDNKIVIAGGQESMTNSHHSINIRNHEKMGNRNLNDTMLSDGLIDAFEKYHMGITAENIAKKYNISREEQDEFAYNSHQKAIIAKTAGKFKNEITEIELKSKNGNIIFDFDESIRDDISMESLSKLKTVFDKNGTVTAGNASGINDGASAILLADYESVKKNNLNPIAKIKSSASYGVDPKYMGIAPVFAVRNALQKANWNIDDLDLIEANEAFAVQSIAVNNELRWDLSKVNINGGAVALGHPIGASGARILTTLIHNMKNMNKAKSIATLCIGGGMGIALCIEKI